MKLYFSEYFEVESAVLNDFGAFDICIVSDLPLFIDPFLLFNSEKPEYQKLHEEIIKYLKFLRDKSNFELDPYLVEYLYCFKEVKQNWLGFTVLGNGGSGLGKKFAISLNEALGNILKNLGDEQITSGTHLEKLGLIKPGVGKDNISDFTTNLIKGYLLEYTQEFASSYIDHKYCETFAVSRAQFNYATESWETRRYYLPSLRSDFVLLTPEDLLTRDETWISRTDMVRNFERLPYALSDGVLRAQVNNYFADRLGFKPTSKKRTEAVQDTVAFYPELLDHYIRIKEEEGEIAARESAKKVEEVNEILVRTLKLVIADIQSRTDIYSKPWGSLGEALERVHAFKQYVENQDGYLLINSKDGRVSKENEVQIFFGLIWRNSDFDVNREVNNGRGPVDFKISKGSKDSVLVEFKLGGNSKLKQNLQNQVEVYKAANQTEHAIKVIICFTERHETRVRKILKELDLQNDPYVVVIDARNDNKPSGSKA